MIKKFIAAFAVMMSISALDMHAIGRSSSSSSSKKQASTKPYTCLVGRTAQGKDLYAYYVPESSMNFRIDLYEVDPLKPQFHQMIGYVACLCAQEARINRLFVYREYRKSDHGKRLVDLALQEFATHPRKYTKAWLFRDAIDNVPNEELKIFYTRVGFKPSSSENPRLMTRDLATITPLPAPRVDITPHLKQGEEFLKAGVQGNVEAVKRFIAVGVNPNLRGLMGNTALMNALIPPTASSDMVAYLVEKAGVVVDMQDDEGSSALILAARNKDWKSTRLLIEKGKANKALCDNTGHEAYIYAFDAGNVAMADYLNPRRSRL